MLKDRVLIAFSTFNAPHFLNHLVSGIERYDPGYPFDLLIMDHSSTDSRQLRLLDRLAGRYRVETRPNLGRAQGGYQHAWQNNKGYKYYFFLHDDSSIIRNLYIKMGIDRLHDHRLEQELPEDIARLPVGKVGYQAYRWGCHDMYVNSPYPCIFRYMGPVAKALGLQIPLYYQHINDDRLLFTNEMLAAAGKIWSLEDFRQIMGTDTFSFINNFFRERFPGNGWIQPKDIYNGADWEGFQTTCEFLNDMLPMLAGFRTHCLVGDGYVQEELGWSRFWGSEYVNHFGSHSVFKRLALLLKVPEEEIRARYRQPSFLALCDSIIRKETDDDIAR
jgi:hypothetical protein